jgi:hypothetical protein
MSWSTINFKEVNPATVDVIPEGTYTFRLNNGAKYADSQAILASATIESDGEFRGKRVLFSYPDPESLDKNGKVQDWSKVAFKRLEVALGQDVEDGEDPVAYLNRVAGGVFMAGVKVREDNSGTKRSNLQILNVKPAA